MLELSVLQQAVKAAYGLEVEDWTVVEERDGIHRLCCNGRVYALKKNRYPLQEFLYIHSAVQHIYNNGFPAINHMLPAIDGKPLIDCGTESYFLSPWLAGREADYTDQADVVLSARGIARFHRATFCFVPNIYEGRIKWGQTPDMIQHKKQDVLRWGERAREKDRPRFFDFLYRKQVGFYYDQLDKALRVLSPYYEQANKIACARGGFCHHDLAYHNLLLRPGDTEDLALIDFDYCISDPNIHDLASFLLRIIKANDWLPFLAMQALEAYESVLPVSYAEKMVMLGLMQMPQQFWQLGLAYYEELDRIPDEVFRRQRLHKLEARLAHFLDSEESRAAALAAMAVYLKGKEGVR